MTSPSPDRVFATHQRIADTAGVSRSTVSRALQSSSRISEETRRRVKEAARQLGYRPNPFVAAMMEHIRKRRGYTFQGKIAVLSDREDGVRWHLRKPNWTRLYQGARERAAELGFELENFCTRDYDPDGRRLSEVLATRGIHGVLISPATVSPKMELNWGQFSVASVGYSLKSPRFHRVCNDNFVAIQVACHRLLRMGYRRIGLHLRTRQDEITDSHNRAGFMVVQNDLIPVRDRIPVELINTPKSPAGLLKWLTKAKPEVVLSYRCGKLLRWAKQAGVDVPGELGLVELDHSPDSPQFAGIDHKAEFLGRAAVDLIVAQIGRNETGVPETPSNLTIEGFWVDGPSVREAGRAATATAKRSAPVVVR